jgi:methylthioribose-1-phosphate isomerase
MPFSICIVDAKDAILNYITGSGVRDPYATIQQLFIRAAPAAAVVAAK